MSNPDLKPCPFCGSLAGVKQLKQSAIVCGNGGESMAPKSILYMAVTADEYELPIFVTDSLDALAKWANVTVNGLLCMISRMAKKAPYKPKSYSPYRYRKVFILEENWHECDP